MTESEQCVLEIYMCHVFCFDFLYAVDNGSSDMLIQTSQGYLLAMNFLLGTVHHKFVAMATRLVKFTFDQHFLNIWQYMPIYSQQLYGFEPSDQPKTKVAHIIHFASVQAPAWRFQHATWLRPENMAYLVSSEDIFRITWGYTDFLTQISSSLF